MPNFLGSIQARNPLFFSSAFYYSAGNLHHFVGFPGGWFGEDYFLGLVEYFWEKLQLHFQAIPGTT